MHMIGNDCVMTQFGAATQLHPDWGLLSRLRQEGRETAKQWLVQNVEQVGRGSTIDLVEMFL
jgi:NTE family protein